ncbi:MAG: response regulator, partial [Pseudomonadota bacterium]
MFEGKRILIVDDDASFRTEVASFLASRGFSVYSKGTKDHFLASLEADSPDIVLLDKEIGKEDGFDLIHSVRHHGTHNALPIIIVTGHSNLENKKQAILLGADDLISKPVSLEELE